MNSRQFLMHHASIKVSYGSYIILYLANYFRLHLSTGKLTPLPMLQVRFPQLVVAGGREGRPRHPGQSPLPPGLSSQRRPVDEADCLVRQTQADEQPAG